MNVYDEAESIVKVDKIALFHHHDQGRFYTVYLNLESCNLIYLIFELLLLLNNEDDLWKETADTPLGRRSKIQQNANGKIDYFFLF